MTNPRKSSTSSDEARLASRRKGHGRVTLSDVANLAQVTPMTVSRYLRSPDKVTPDTAQKIAQALQITGYTPNIQAGNLASGRSHAVAVIVPNMSHSIFADTLHGLGEGLQDNGLQMLVASSNYSLEQEEQQIRAVLGWAPAGLIVTGRHHSAATEQMLMRAMASGIAVIEMWDQRPVVSNKASDESMRLHDFPLQAIHQVGFDHLQAGHMMADALFTRDYAQWLFIDSGVQQDFRAHARAQGFMQRATQLNQRCDSIQTDATTADAVEAGRTLMRQWLSHHAITPDFSLGMACANDMLAVGAWLAVQEQALSCPQQIGLLGFGDFPLGRHWAGGLSTLRIDGERIGRQCAALLQQLRSDRNAQLNPASMRTDERIQTQWVISPELIWRAS